jgi:periplasmic protein TonB
MEEREEKENKRKAAITTAIIQVLLLLALYFLIAWREPFPPNPEYGIELNFGTSSSGSGQTPVTSTSQSNEQEDASAAQAKPQEQVQEADKPADPAPKPAEPQQKVSPDKVENTKPTTTSTTKTEETKKDQKDSKSQTSTTTNTSQGNTTEKKGDQGDPQGKINADALYGTSGGGNDGSSLALAGWVWDSPPKPDDKSQDAGKIVFKITVDSFGELIKVELVSSSVSSEIVKKYQNAVEELTFSKTSDYKPAPTSTGTITFIIRSR